jgi:hypothetical protein
MVISLKITNQKNHGSFMPQAYVKMDTPPTLEEKHVFSTALCD